MTNEELRKMQLLQLDMIAEVDRICRKYDIPYIIYGGTMIGAIRHKGYIPWDDDADIGMLRENYEKFKSHIDELNPDTCFFQDHDTDPEYFWGYGKLRRTGTVYIRKGQEHMKYQNGVCIDIEPFDDVPNNLLLQILMEWDCFLLRKICWARVGKKNAKGIAKLVYEVLSLIPISYVFSRYNHYAKRSRNDSGKPVRILSLPSLGNDYVKTNPWPIKFGTPRKWLTERAEYDFETLKLYGPKDYDGYLKYHFGDYMTLPPEDKRDMKHNCSYFEF